MHPRTTIGIAAGIYFVVVTLVPFGDTLLYPFTLFTTWVHEMGHGLTALVAGGTFESLEIRSTAGGTAYAYAAPGWPDAMVAAMGMLLPPILGAIILAAIHDARRARVLLTILAGALVGSVAIYVRSAAGLIAMPIVALALGWSAWLGFRENPERRVLVAQVLGVILALDTLTRMVGYAFKSESRRGHVSDVGLIAKNLGGHYLLWGLAITVIALGALALGLWWAWRRPEVVSSPARRPGAGTPPYRRA